MKTICVMLLALLMSFDSGLASKVDVPSAFFKRNLTEEIKNDLQALTGKWMVYRVSLSPTDDESNDNVENTFVEYKEISYDQGHLTIKSYRTDKTKAVESQAGFDGQKFVMKENYGRDESFDIVAYGRQIYLALKPSNVTSTQTENDLGFLWTYGGKKIVQSKVVDLNVKPEDKNLNATAAKTS